MAKIRLSPLALSDLKEVKEYITDELCNPIAANRIVTKIIKDYSLLEPSQKLGPFQYTVFYTEQEIILKSYFLIS